MAANGQDHDATTGMWAFDGHAVKPVRLTISGNIIGAIPQRMGLHRQVPTLRA